MPCVWQGPINHDALCGFLPPALHLSSNVLLFQLLPRQSLHFNEFFTRKEVFFGAVHVAVTAWTTSLFSFMHSHWIGNRGPIFECEEDRVEDSIKYLSEPQTNCW